MRTVQMQVPIHTHFGLSCCTYPRNCKQQVLLLGPVTIALMRFGTRSLDLGTDGCLTAASCLSSSILCEDMDVWEEVVPAILHTLQLWQDLHLHVPFRCYALHWKISGSPSNPHHLLSEYVKLLQSLDTPNLDVHTIVKSPCRYAYLA